MYSTYNQYKLKIKSFLFTDKKYLKTYPKHSRFCINRNKLKEKNTIANVNILARKNKQQETVSIKSYILYQIICHNEVSSCFSGYHSSN